MTHSDIYSILTGLAWQGVKHAVYSGWNWFMSDDFILGLVSDINYLVDFKYTTEERV